jgi:hypothetical protein
MSDAYAKAGAAREQMAEAERAVLKAIRNFRTRWMLEQIADAAEHPNNPRIQAMVVIFDAELKRRQLERVHERG